MGAVYVEVDKDALKKLVDEFTAMPEKAKDTLHEAVNKGAEYLKPKIQSNIKPGKDDDNKKLRNTVRVSKAKRRKSIKQTATVRIGGIKDVEYPMHLETGHMTEDGKHIPARPYIRSASDNNQEKVADIVANYILDSMGL